VYFDRVTEADSLTPLERLREFEGLEEVIITGLESDFFRTYDWRIPQFRNLRKLVLLGVLIISIFESYFSVRS